jgi:hypothetical protein
MGFYELYIFFADIDGISPQRFKFCGGKFIIASIFEFDIKLQIVRKSALREIT